MTRSQEFIKTYSNKLEAASEFFNFDSALQKRKQFKDAKFRFLLILPCPAANKAVSSTAAVFNDYFQHYHPDWFIDFAWMPSDKDIKLFDANQLPYAIGAVTHLDPSHFDMVGISLSILHEMITTPVIISSFSRCDKPIPLSWTERKDVPLGTHPYIVAGGVTSPHSDLLFGELGDGRQAYVDCLMLGDCDPIGEVIERMLKAKEETPAMTLQDFIDSTFDIPSVYQPQAYEVVYKDNVIISNKKINPKAPDQVHPFHAEKFNPKRLYTARTLTPGSGENAGTAQYMMSTGCAGKANCNFCSEGWYGGPWRENPHEGILWSARESRKYSAASAIKSMSFNCIPSDTYIPLPEGKFTKARNLQGEVLGMAGNRTVYKEMVETVHPKMIRLRTDRYAWPIQSPNHRVPVLTENGIKVKRADEVKVGDVLMNNIGYNTPVKADPHSQAYFLGLWFGDGTSYKKPDGKRCNFQQLIAAREEKLTQHCRESGMFSALNDTVRQGVRIFYYGEPMKKYIRSIFPNAKTEVNLLHTLSLQDLISFLRGWFDADGCCCVNEGHSQTFLTAKEGHLKTLRFASLVLNSIGVETSMRTTTVKLEQTGKSYKRWDLKIIGVTSRRIFNEFIGFTEDKNHTVSASNWAKGDGLPAVAGLWLKNSGYSTQGLNLGRFFRGGSGISEEQTKKLSIREHPVFEMFDSGVRFCKVLKAEVIDGDCECTDIVEVNDGIYLTEFGLTHNTNFHSKFKQNLFELRKFYRRVKFNNMRLNEIGHDYDQWKMMSYLGQTHFAAPIEGISERIRNGILNKGLDNKSIDLVFDNLIGQSVSDIKVGVVLTGYETDEDWQDLYNTFEKVTEKAKVYNKKYPMRIKITGLVHYPGTPLWFSERVLARKAFNKERFLTNEQYQRNVDHDIRVKFNGFIGSTFMEQALIDLGRSLTPWVQRNFVVKNHVLFALNSAIKDERAWDELKNMIVSEKFWQERDPDNCITPFHRIRLELQGALIASARALISNVHSKEHRASVRCLYTYDGCKTVCGSMDMKNNLHTEMGDCEIIDGKRVGQELRKLSGCDSCKTPEERVKYHLKRKIYNSEISVEDLKAQYLGADFSKYRFVVERKAGGFKELNPANTAYMSIASLLRASERLLDTYWEVHNYSNARQTEPGMPYNVSGRMVVDVTFRDEVLADIKAAIPIANADLDTCQIKGVYMIDTSDTLKADDLVLYRFETPLSYSSLLMDCKMYKGEIDIMKMDLYEHIEDKTLKAPVLIPKEGKTVGYFTLSSRYNPLIYLSCFVKHKSVGKHEARAIFDVQSLDILRESSLTCKCGNYALVSLSSNQTFSCKSCITKQLASKESKQSNKR